MTEESEAKAVENLSANECWELLRASDVGRLAVWVQDHPDIFPVNYAVDHGTVVFRTGEGTKVSNALSDTAVALEIDGYQESSSTAWSVVIKGRAEVIRRVEDLMETVDLPLFPWQGGKKDTFIRIVPNTLTGRRFPVVDADAWQTSLSKVSRSSTE